jgi:predicted transglutaminase-like cysteine proteinase
MQQIVPSGGLQMTIGSHPAEVARPSFTGRRLLRALCHAIGLCLAVWGVVALVLLLYLRPIAIRDTQVVSIVPAGAIPFCLRTPQDCPKSSPAAISKDAFYDIDDLNYTVNRAIFAEPIAHTMARGINFWRILADGSEGSCIDYALTKRHRLIGLGYPSGAFSVAVVHVNGSPASVYHAVLVARLADQLYVLDNLTNHVAHIEDRDDLTWVSHSGFGDLWDWQPGAPSPANFPRS